MGYQYSSRMHDIKPVSGPWHIVQRLNKDLFVLGRIRFERASKGVEYGAMPDTKFCTKTEAKELLNSDPYWDATSRGWNARSYKRRLTRWRKQITAYGWRL